MAKSSRDSNLGPCQFRFSALPQTEQKSNEIVLFLFRETKTKSFQNFYSLSGIHPSSYQWYTLEEIIFNFGHNSLSLSLSPGLGGSLDLSQNCIFFKSWAAQCSSKTLQHLLWSTLDIRNYDEFIFAFAFKQLQIFISWVQFLPTVKLGLSQATNLRIILWKITIAQSSWNTFLRTHYWAKEVDWDKKVQIQRESNPQPLDHELWT